MAELIILIVASLAIIVCLVVCVASVVKDVRRWIKIFKVASKREDISKPLVDGSVIYFETAASPAKGKTRRSVSDEKPKRIIWNGGNLT